MRAKIVAVVLLSLCGLSSWPATAEDWTLVKALAEIDRQTKRFKTWSAQVDITRVGSPEPDVSGRVLVRSDGRLRLDTGGADDPVYLALPGTIWIHRPANNVVERRRTGDRPEMLAQYMLLGFDPRGSDWNDLYYVTFRGEEELDGSPTLRFELQPKSQQARSLVSKVDVWISQQTWLPVRHTAYQGGPDKSATASYRDVVVDGTVDPAAFKPRWPKGTRVVDR